MSFVTSKAQVTWASSMVDHQMLDSLAILTLTGLQTGMTGSQLEHIHSSWQMVPLPGLPRNNMLSHSPPLSVANGPARGCGPSGPVAILGRLGRSVGPQPHPAP